MSILADRSNPLPTYEEARGQLYGHVLGGAACVVIVLLVPKDLLGWDMFRLALAAVFFLGLTTMAWGAAEPLEAYLRARIELSLEDFGTESKALGHAAIDAVSRYLSRLVWLVLAVLGLLFLRVLAAWPVGEPLEPVMPLIHIAFWVALAALPVQVFLSTNRLTEALSLWRSFQQQIARSRFRPKTIADARARAAELEGPPIVVTGPYTFRAGGTEWAWSDFQKNAIVFGQTGSGKTVTILNAFLDGLLSSADGRAGTEAAAVLMLDPKGDYRDKIERLCARLGRSDDLMILDPNRPAISVRWNPFDGPDDALEVSERFAGVLQLLGMKNTQDTFWIDTAKTFLRHAIGLLRASEPADRPPSFVGISELATQPVLLEARLFVLHAKALLAAVRETDLDAGALASNEAIVRGMLTALPRSGRGIDALRAYFRRWDAMPAAERGAMAKEAVVLAARLADAPVVDLSPGSEALLAAEYLANTWLAMPERTRGSVQTQLTTMIDPFLSEPYRTIFSGRSTVTLGDMLDRGRIFYVFMPREERSAMSRVVNTLIKLEFFRQVLLRLHKTRPSLFFCDEFQSFFTSDEGRGDGPFFERSRQSFHANVVATQNLSGLLRDVPKEETIHNFLGNCAIKLFLRNTEGKTNEFAEKSVFGEYLGFVTTVGRSFGDRGGKEGFHEGASISVTAQTLPVVAAERLTQLAIPDKDRGIAYAEALVHLGSRAAVTIDRLRFKVHPLDA
jgi:hypothetical protein